MRKIVSIFMVIVLVVLVMTPSTVSVARTKVDLKPTWRNILWLAKTMQCENGSGTDEQVILTGIVICQRVRASSYPDTIKGVISQPGQYVTWKWGRIQSCNPDERCLEIAEEILRYKLYRDYPHNLVFQSEFKQGKAIYKKIGNEYFCLA